MKAFENAQYDASGLLPDYERELNRLRDRWDEVETWYDRFSEDYRQKSEAWSDVESSYLERHAKWRTIWARRELAQEANKTRKWWETQEPVPELPPEPEKPKKPAGFSSYSVPVETILYNQFLDLRAELQAGYQSAKLGSTLNATPGQMTEIFAIVKGTRLDNLFSSFEKLNPPRPDAGNN